MGITLDHHDRLPCIYKASDIRRLSRGAFTHTRWLDYMLNPSFLGRRFTNGAHLYFIHRLRVAERYLLALPAYSGKTPVQIGAALGINEKHKGARPTATSRSMHTLGLATDINYLTTPWIVNPGNTSGTRDFIAVMERATKLISDWTVRVDAAYLHGLGSGGRSTTSVYDELKRRSDDLRQYLALQYLLYGGEWSLGFQRGLKLRLSAHYTDHRYLNILKG